MHPVKTVPGGLKVLALVGKSGMVGEDGRCGRLRLTGRGRKNCSIVLIVRLVKRDGDGEVKSWEEGEGER